MLRRRSSLDDRAVDHAHAPAGARADLGIMGDEHHGAAVVMQALQQP